MTQEPQTQTKLDCSIIIPNLHSPVIDRTLQSILSQVTDRSYEIIVVGMDNLGWWKVPRGQIHQNAAPVGAAEARNIGIREAASDTLIFIDADCIALPGWIDTFFADFAEGWQVIGGGVKSPTDNFWLLVYNLSMFHEQLATQPPRGTSPTCQP